MTPGYIVVMPPLCAGPSGGGRSSNLLVLAQLHKAHFLVAVNKEDEEAGSGHLINRHWS